MKLRAKMITSHNPQRSTKYYFLVSLQITSGQWTKKSPKQLWCFVHLFKMANNPSAHLYILNITIFLKINTDFYIIWDDYKINCPLQ